MPKKNKKYHEQLEKHVVLNCHDYRKYKEKQHLGYLLFLFTELTKNKLAIPEELQKHITEAIEKGWLTNTMPKPKGAKKQTFAQLSILDKLFKQMIDKRYTKVYSLDSYNKHVEHFAKKNNVTATKLYKTRDKYGDLFKFVMNDYFYTAKTRISQIQKKVLDDFFTPSKNNI